MRKRHRMSLATGMFAILLIAINLAGFRTLAWPALDFAPLHLALSLLPMANILAILGYRLAQNPRARNPFALGFFVFGLGAMLLHVACVRLDFEHVKWTYVLSNGRFFQLCKAYRVPYYIGKSREGYSYFRFYPFSVLVNFCVPQLVAACLGGLAWLRLTRWTRKRQAVASAFPSSA